MWGLTEGPDGRWYGSGFFNGISRGTLDPDSFDDGAGGCGSSEVWMTLADFGITPNFNSEDFVPIGLTFDDEGFLYVAFSQGFGFTAPSYIVKVDPATKTVIDQTSTDSATDADDNDGMNWAAARGIVFSEASGLIYASTLDDCIAAFDKNLNYQPGSSVHIRGEFPKGIGINTECCPTNNNLTIDTTLCAAAMNDQIFLQELISCDGTICEGQWQEGGTNTGLTYNECDNTITIDALNACGTFTLESDGTGNNPQCGAFKITVNINVGNITAPVIAANQTVCEGDDPAAFTLTTAAAGSNTVAYQWQSSTTDCATDFMNISGANSDTYDPPSGIMQTTYYRVISAVDGGCSSGMCTDTSNCVIVTVNPLFTANTASLAVCDDGDGTVDFDLTSAENTVTGGASGVTVAWFTDAALMNAIAAPTAYASSGGTVYAEVTNTSTTCTASAAVTLTVNTLPTAIATATPATCVNGTSTANNDGMITLSGFAGTDTYQYNTGSTFNAGTATPAAPMTIPGDGIIAINLANPIVSQTYTVRITGSNGCFIDRTVTLNETRCDADIDYPDYSSSIRPCDDEPCHTISPDLYLGQGVSGDTAPAVNESADSDDDDGVWVGENMQFVPGNTVRFPVTIYNNAGSFAHLRMWIDWNGDGDFVDSDEQIENDTYPSTGAENVVLISVTIPTDAVQITDIALRVRLSTDDANSAEPCSNGNCATDGEIEDYLLHVDCPTKVCPPVQLLKTSGNP